MLLVMPTANHCYVDPTTRDEIQFFRPSVCGNSNFMQARIAAGDIKLLAADLSDEATDLEFCKYLKESGNQDLAVSSFIKAFSNIKDATKEEAKQLQDSKDAATLLAKKD